MTESLRPIIHQLGRLARSILDNSVAVPDHQDELIQAVLALPADVLVPSAAADLRRAVLSGVPQRILTQLMALTAPAAEQPAAPAAEQPAAPAPAPAPATPADTTILVETPAAASPEVTP